MPQLTQQDPFTQIHGALWAALTANQTWSAFVPPGNRVASIPGIPTLGQSIAGIEPKPNYIKGAAQEPADTPEVRICQSGYAEEHPDSVAIFFAQRFLVQLGSSTPLQDMTPLNQLKWLTRVALYRTNNQLDLPNLVTSFVCGAAAEKDAPPPEDSNYDNKIWYTALPILVRFYINDEVFRMIS
jgi:hypothetical protein